MSHPESPIHPLLASLIAGYKNFSQVPFPRGLPEPITPWRPLLQAVTQFEAQCIPEIHNYLNGEAADLNKTRTPAQLKSHLNGFATQTPVEQGYLQKLKDYLKDLEQLCTNLQSCATELGNPCQTFRSEDTAKNSF